MRKAALMGPVLAFVLGWVLYVGTDSASAIPPFKKEFDLKYVKKDSSDPTEKKFAAEVEKAKCNVCHVGKDKKKRNVYGEALAELLDKKADAKNPEKIKESLDKVAKMKSTDSDANAPTFGDLITEGKLPGGEVPADAAAGAE